MTFAVPEPGPDDPRAIVAQLIDTCAEFDLLRLADARILVLFRTVPKVRGGRPVLGTLTLPAFTGALADLAAWLLAEHAGDPPPDFLLILDRDWWQQADARSREAMLFHQLMHHGQAADKEGEPRYDADGRPVWMVRAADVAVFHAELRRYGAWSPELTEMMAAAAANRMT